MNLIILDVTQGAMDRGLSIRGAPPKEMPQSEHQEWYNLSGDSLLTGYLGSKWKGSVLVAPSSIQGLLLLYQARQAYMAGIAGRIE